MFISEQYEFPVSEGYFVAGFHMMDRYATQLWPFKLALDFVRAFGGH